MLGFALRGPDCHGFAAEFGAAGKIIYVQAQNCEIVQGRRQIRMLVAQYAPLHGQRLTVQRISFPITLQPVEGSRLVCQREGMQRMVIREQATVNRYRLVERRQGLRDMLRLHAKDAEIDQIFGDIEMIVPV